MKLISKTKSDCWRRPTYGAAFGLAWGAMAGGLCGATTVTALLVEEESAGPALLIYIPFAFVIGSSAGVIPGAILGSLIAGFKADRHASVILAVILAALGILAIPKEQFVLSGELTLRTVAVCGTSVLGYALAGLLSGAGFGHCIQRSLQPLRRNLANTSVTPLAANPTMTC